MRSLLCLLALVFPTTSGLADDATPASKQLDRGKTIYAESCASCHGDNGEGVEGAYADALIGDSSVRELAEHITKTMPEGEPETCVGEDAAAVAAYVHQAFYSEAAQIRLDPPRVRLAHLTGNQLRQSLADLYGRFAGPMWKETKRGLTGKYFDGARYRRERMKIERVDPRVDFDWKDKGPGKGINPKDFFVQWSGSLKVDETGPYTIVIRSTCAFICNLGGFNREFINNRVQSGGKTEFRKTIVLTAGRAYRFNIDLYQRKRKTEQPPASISLSWVPPGGAEQIIPERHLIPNTAPPTFSLQANTPPDDRSNGFERGLSLDREWDSSTTSAAVEFGKIAADELWPQYNRKGRRGRKPKDTDADREKLKQFLTELVETAFRGPLDAESKKFYIDEQISQTKDDEAAIKRCLLVALKSPRFLYPALDANRSLSQRAANRLALTLYDSLPSDEWFRKLAAENKLANEQQVRQAAHRMVDDYRCRAKTRELMYEWLNLAHHGAITKDDKKFPRFNQQIVTDLKASLDAFLDDVIWGQRSDFRQLFLADWSFTTPQLAAYYGDGWKPADASATGLAKSAAGGHRYGLLSHPYMMSGLAYRDSTSPIHRGVFLMRFVLGRTLRPPKEAFTPISPKLHPDLTTRQRVELQTSPQACQGCHTKINGLGFALEEYDAVGRFREKEEGKPLDISGRYTARDGSPVTFQGTGELAKYLAGSHDVHRAFVKRAFQHFVKQPIAAFGANRLDELTEKFRNDGFNIRNLIVEIAVIAALKSQPEA